MKGQLLFPVSGIPRYSNMSPLMQGHGNVQQLSRPGEHHPAGYGYIPSSEARLKYRLLHCRVHHAKVCLCVWSPSCLSNLTRCDDVNMHGTSKGLKDVQRTFSHAMKLRAGTTFGFCKAGRRGKVPWDRATALGNPSISDLVSSYMLGLHKRKVCCKTHQ